MVLSLTLSKLDICDLGQTFGNLVSCLTAVSTPVLLSVVNLASSLSKETAQEGNGNANGRTLASSSSAAPQPLQADLSTRLLCQVLCESRWILSGELGASSCQGIDHFAEISSPPPLSFATHPIDIATYYLILRFGMNCNPPPASIATDNAPKTLVTPSPAANRPVCRSGHPTNSPLASRGPILQRRSSGPPLTS